MASAHLSWPHPIAAIAAMAIVSLSLPVSAVDAERLIDTEHSTIMVRVFNGGLFRAFMDDHVIRAPIIEGSIQDPPHVALLIDARAIQVLDPGRSPQDREAVQTRMLGPEVLDVQRFERIYFHSVVIRQMADTWRVEGELELHGQIHPVNVDVRVEQGHYKGSASVLQSAFGIAPIRIAGGTVNVKDAVQVDFDIVPADK
jgi:hypothetical protein